MRETTYYCDVCGDELYAEQENGEGTTDAYRIKVNRVCSPFGTVGGSRTLELCVDEIPEKIQPRPADVEYFWHLEDRAVVGAKVSWGHRYGGEASYQERDEFEEPTEELAQTVDSLMVDDSWEWKRTIVF